MATRIVGDIAAATVPRRCIEQGGPPDVDSLTRVGERVNGNRISLWDIVWDIVAEKGILPGSSKSRHLHPVGVVVHLIGLLPVPVISLSTDSC